MRNLLMAITMLATAAPAIAGGPLGEAPKLEGRRTQVLTLGTLHLSEVQTFDPAWLAPLLDRLAAYRPDVITIESLSGEQCAMLKANDDAYADAFDQYCWDLGEIEKATGFSTAAANAEIRKSFETWPAAPTAAQRRRMAMLFIAAGDRASAQVQWLRLPTTERRAADGVTDAMLPILNRTSGKRNENYDVAAALAARLGLDRVYPVDDHSSDGAIAHAPKAFEDAIGAHFAALRGSALLERNQRDVASIRDAASTLSYYRKVNAPHAQDAQVAGDFGGALAIKGDQPWGRYYVGWWEVRNLRMVANVRASFAAQPGVKVLNIVGSSHKPWYDALMGMMSDVDVVDAQGVLR